MHFSNITLTAISAAKLATDYLKTSFGTLHTIHEKEGKQNLVTECDLQAEEILTSFIKKTFPTHGFMAEEKGSENLCAEILWVIDPLDGTVNFAKNVPHFAISLAAIRGNEILSGVIINPMTSELFIAEKGKGAFCNDIPLHVSNVNALEKAFLAIGFPYNIDENPMKTIDVFASFLKQGIPLRRFGSAALDLAYVAAGKFDAYFETDLHPWDVAAGILLVEEAGGTISTWEGKKHPLLERSDILASNTSIHEIMKDSIHKGRSL